jgi:hypothetical protein
MEGVKMRKGNLNREEAIKKAGLEAVEKVEALDCNFTNRLQTDGDDSVEFAANVEFVDSEGIDRVLTAYYYQTPEDLERVGDNLGYLNWEIEGYEIW